MNFPRSVYFLTLFLFCLLASPARSQQPPSEAGLKGGLSFATFSSAGSGQSASNNPGFALGGYANYRLSTSFSLQPEILYIQKGVTVNDSGIDFRLQINYIDVPVFAQYHINGNGFGPRLFAGPYASFALSSFSNVEVVDENRLTPDEWLAHTNDVLFGLAAGLGIDREISDRNYFLEVRYHFGLSPVFGETVPGDLTNRAFLLLAGLAF